MGRPVNADAARTRRQLLEVAIEHFGREGYRRATTRRMAAEVGVSFATVHHYFGTKEALFAECIRGSYAQLMSTGVEILAELARAPLNSRIERALRRGFRAALGNAPRSRFLMRAFVFEDPALVAKHVPAHRSKFFDGALQLLGGEGDATSVEERKVALIGIGMLVTRFAAASEFERSFLGAAAFDSDQAIENYLVQVAQTTLGPHLAALPTPLTPETSTR